MHGKQFAQAVGIAQTGKDDVCVLLFMYVNQQVIRVAVNASNGDGGIVRAQECTSRGVNACHTTGKGETHCPAPQAGNRVFQNLTSWITQARVVVRGLLTDFMQHKHAVLIDRRHRRTVVFIVTVTGMDDFGDESYLSSTL